jgi:lipopolysaccharide transport system ATP-binding protein
MANDIAISVEGLSKRYLVGHNDTIDPNATLRDDIVRHARNLARKTRDLARGRQIVQGDRIEDFWALKDVSFEIPRGARVGILGRNGAGKSTLLKLLSRITEPTSGRIRINGRVASLLEVGTGFHPELTGRENVFLNGAILGMSRREIQGKFDEIVAFAEVERFLDTPVKRYSSGMYVRLAFAVAAHLEPEILIVDEVLAVGDAQFQRKCLGKMEDVARGGRTVLFVSHNMAAINQLCQSAVMLDRGTVSFVGGAQAAISKYLKTSDDLPNPADLTALNRRVSDGRVVFQSIAFLSYAGRLTKQFSMGETITIRIVLRSNIDLSGKAISISITSDDGLPICNIVNADSAFDLAGKSGLHAVDISIEDIRLYPGRFIVGVWAGTHDGRDTYDHVESGLSFEILDGGKLTARSLPRTSGLLFLTPRWSISFCDQQVDTTREAVEL